MKLYANPTITDFRQDVNGDIKMLKIGVDKEDAYANIQGQATSKVENNKEATINVSTYTQPVEITPTSGKNSMKKATVTLTNIPSPSGDFVFYAWKGDGEVVKYTLSETPSVDDKVYSEGYNQGDIQTETTLKVKAVGEGTITVTISSSDEVFARYSDGDITLPVS